MAELWESWSQGGSAMYDLRRKLLSQNFLYSRKLVSKLVRSSSLGKNDIVLEIGSGKGIITEQLVKQAEQVIAIELDWHLYNYLKNKLSQIDNLTLYHEDFLNKPLPKVPYKVFANIPFAIEGKIIRKLIDDLNPPQDCYLIMMKELAYRLAAPYKENQFSILHKPWFDFSIPHHFKPTDFTPIPKVSVVLFRFTKKEKPLLPKDEKKKYQQFIRLGFTQGTPAFQNLKRQYGSNQVLSAFHKYNINRTTKPIYIPLQRWIGLYKELFSKF